jgi:hypothetical protein
MPVTPYARNVPVLLCHELFNEASSTAAGYIHDALWVGGWVRRCRCVGEWLGVVLFVWEGGCTLHILQYESPSLSFWTLTLALLSSTLFLHLSHSPRLSLCFCDFILLSYALALSSSWLSSSPGCEARWNVHWAHSLCNYVCWWAQIIEFSITILQQIIFKRMLCLKWRILAVW